LTTETEKRDKLRSDVLRVIQQAIESVNPENAIRKHMSIETEVLHIGDERIDLKDYVNINVIGAGKASPAMGLAVEEVLGEKLKGGVICTKYGSGVRLSKMEVVEASHPIPDERSVLGAQKTLDKVRSYDSNDLVICLISGGASAIWCLPAGKITLKEKVQATEALLDSGADIHEINTVRKHISMIKGGHLARAIYPNRLISLALSDVVGDKFTSIGSGPTTADPTTYQQAINVLNKYSLFSRIPQSVLEHLKAGVKCEIRETPKPEDPIFERNIECIIGSNKLALRTAEETARHLGYNTAILSSELTGEARFVGKKLAGEIKKIYLEKNPVAPPAMLLCGGETTVTVKGDGKGGRNQELVLSAALELKGFKSILVASIGTDGIDGPTDAAGAFADGSTVGRGEELGLDAVEYLERNNSYEYFNRLGELIYIGPTGTNVMDIQVLIAI